MMLNILQQCNKRNILFKKNIGKFYLWKWPQSVLKLAKITDFSIHRSFWKLICQYCNSTLDIYDRSDLDILNINLVILYIISIFKFLSLVYSCIGTFFICSTSTCFCTSHIVSSAGTSSEEFAYFTYTPNKLDHRLWSYCNVWQDRYWNFTSITLPS